MYFHVIQETSCSSILSLWQRNLSNETRGQEHIMSCWDEISNTKDHKRMKKFYKKWRLNLCWAGNKWFQHAHQTEDYRSKICSLFSYILTHFNLSQTNLSLMTGWIGMVQFNLMCILFMSGLVFINKIQRLKVSGW